MSYMIPILNIILNAPHNRIRGPTGAFCLAVWFLSLAAGAYGDEGPKRRILILHSYNQGYQWTDEIQRGIEDAFAGRTELELVVDYMFANDYRSEDYERLLLGLYEYKYGGEAARLELVIVSDDHALNFALSKRDALFPGVPIVFCGINDLKPEALRGHDGVTGVNEAQDMRATLELGLRLAPWTERIAVLAGERLSERINLETFKGVASDYAGAYEIRYLEGLTAAQAREAIRGFGRETLVIYLSYMLDAAGEALDWREGVALAASNPALAVLVMSDFQVRGGALGGRVLSGRGQGEAAARLALRILDGEDPGSIPPVMESPALYLFDDRALERLGIEYASLPPSYELTNLRTGEFINDWHVNGSKSFFSSDLFENHGTNMLLIDPSNGIIVDANQAARRFYGYPRLIGMDIARINAAGEELTRAELTRARGLEENFFSFSHRLADGSVKEVISYSWPVKVRDTELLFSIIFDVTPQRRAEALAAYRNSQIIIMMILALALSAAALAYLLWSLSIRKAAQARLRRALSMKSALLDAIPNPVFHKDLLGRYQEWNRAFESFLGVDGDMIAGKTVAELVSQEDAAVHEGMDRKLYEDPSSVQSYEMAHGAAGGERRDILVHKAAVRDESRAAEGLVGIYTDLRELKRRENQLKVSLEHNRALIKELHHRTKNNMQTIISLLNLQAGDQADPALGETLRDVAQRIWAMALVHDQLHKSGDLSRLPLQRLITELISSTVRNYADGYASIDQRIDCPDTLILIDYALPLAMALNELVTNSCKHAFKERRMGAINLDVHRDDSAMIELDYRDDGPGLSDELIPSGSGKTSGLTIVRMLVEHQLSGSLSFAEGPGMHCTIRFPEGSYHERVRHESHAC